jgi:hypothetical protein
MKYIKLYKLSLGFVVLALSSCLLFGCTYAGQNYRPSFENVEELAKCKSCHKINVAPFTAARHGASTVMCRAVGPVGTPGGIPFAQYIHEAFVKELKRGNLYAEDAPVVLRGHLNEINFSSVSGNWTIDMTFDDGKHSPFRVAIQHKFTTHFVGDVACVNAANALSNAVEQFLSKLYQDSEFQQVLRQAKK